MEKQLHMSVTKDMAVLKDEMEISLSSLRIYHFSTSFYQTPFSCNPVPPFCFISHASLGLTSPLLLHATLAFLLPPFGLLHLLVLATLVEVLHHNTHKHVEDEETDNQQEGDKVEQHPRIVIGRRLGGKKREIWENKSEGEGEELNREKDIRQGTTAKTVD